jgi:hypothetical protein
VLSARLLLLFGSELQWQWLDLLGNSSNAVESEVPLARDGLGFALVFGAGMSGRLAVFGGASGSASTTTYAESIQLRRLRRFLCA